MPPKLRRRLLRYLPKLRFFLIGVLIGVFFLGIFKFAPSALNFFRNLSLGSSIFWSVVAQKPLVLKETDGRTNVLLLGKPGGSHDGANLTDTIIFSSIDLKTDDIVIVSLPRDIWIPALKAKINSAYEFGENKKPGGGMILAKAIVTEVLGQPIHYTVVIDFSGFEKMIDLLGGIEIDVENTFDDYKYPIEGKENDYCNGDPEYSCRFEHLHFDKGPQFINGERALKFVRSRQAEGNEGTDFARSRRQQKLLLALKNKILSYETLLNPGKIMALEKIFGENIATDIQTSEIDDFIKLVKKLNLSEIKTIALDTGDKKTGREGFLINPSPWEYNGAWVLIPRFGDFSQIQDYLESQLVNPN